MYSRQEGRQGLKLVHIRGLGIQRPTIQRNESTLRDIGGISVEKERWMRGPKGELPRAHGLEKQNLQSFGAVLRLSIVSLAHSWRSAGPWNGQKEMERRKEQPMRQRKFMKGAWRRILAGLSTMLPLLAPACMCRLPALSVELSRPRMQRCAWWIASSAIDRKVNM